jgi:hypothetical protein
MPDPVCWSYYKWRQYRRLLRRETSTSLRTQLCRALSTASRRAAETGAVAMSVPFVPIRVSGVKHSFRAGVLIVDHYIRATPLDVSFRAGVNAAPRHVDFKNRSGQLNCPSHNLTKVGCPRYFPCSTASIITSNDNTAPYLFNPTDCSQIWAPSRKPFSCSHAEAGTGASWSGTDCFL